MLAVALPENSENGVAKRGRGRPAIITLPIVEQNGQLIAKGRPRNKPAFALALTSTASAQPGSAILNLN